MARGLRWLGVPRVEVAGQRRPRYLWLPDASTLLGDDEVTAGYDGVLVMDGDKHRLGPGVAAAFQAAGLRAIVDHHHSTRGEGYHMAWVDAHAASTCEMVLTLLDAWGVPVDADTGALLYAGMLYDTGGFRYSNTRPATLRAAARLVEAGVDHADLAVRVLMERTVAGQRACSRIQCEAALLAGGRVMVGRARRDLLEGLGATEADLEGLVDTLLYVRGVEVAVLLVERGPGRTKVSLRSRGRVDVSTTAAAADPSGGGHAKAAGVVLDRDLDATEARLLEVLLPRLPAAP